MPSNEIIGQRLKELRKSRNKTTIELAQALNVSTSTVGMWESGQRVPRDELKKSIADYFNKTVESIFFKD